MASEPVYAVTGTAGYLGGKIADHLRRRGRTVYGLSRRVDADASRHVPYELERAPSPELFRSRRVDVLIHAAYDFSLTTWRDIAAVNVQGSRDLIRAAREGGVARIIVISTMSAFPGCRSLYGRAKLLIETEAMAAAAVVLRPGLVHAADAGGVFGKLQQAVLVSPVVPYPATGRSFLHLVSSDDLCRVVEAMSVGDLRASAGPLIVAHPRPLPLVEILRMIARRRGRRPIFVPIPWQAIWAGLKLLELGGAGIGLRSDSVLSLANQDPAPRFDGAFAAQAGIAAFAG
jgi:nucleoside-diphosphate-sugar epimerase